MDHAGDYAEPRLVEIFNKDWCHGLASVHVRTLAERLEILYMRGQELRIRAEFRRLDPSESYVIRHRECLRSIAIRWLVFPPGTTVEHFEQASTRRTIFACGSSIRHQSQIISL